MDIMKKIEPLLLGQCECSSSSSPFDMPRREPFQGQMVVMVARNEQRFCCNALSQEVIGRGRWILAPDLKPGVVKNDLPRIRVCRYSGS